MSEPSVMMFGLGTISGALKRINAPLSNTGLRENPFAIVSPLFLDLTPDDG
jgi:hypothetical protein